MAELTGQVLRDRYRIEAFLGRGGMADVYKVRDLQRAAFLAMKVLHADLAKDQAFLKHFVQEAQTLEKLQHPNIVRFYGLEKANKLAFILMDFIDGLTLRREIFLFQNSLRPMRVLEVMQPVCAALYYAHQMGMLHCDIKPGNIITHRNGTVFLTDFGISRAREPGGAALAGVGTPAYMAPEQFEGKQPSQATDIYSLGVVIFEMLTGGQRPFSGDSTRNGSTTTQRIIWEKKNLQAPSPRVFNPEITPELEAVVLCCLQRNPQLRFHSALDLLHALEMAMRGAQPPEDEAQTRVDLVKKAGGKGRASRARQVDKKAENPPDKTPNRGQVSKSPATDSVQVSAGSKTGERVEGGGKTTSKATANPLSRPAVQKPAPENQQPASTAQPSRSGEVQKPLSGKSQGVIPAKEPVHPEKASSGKPKPPGPPAAAAAAKRSQAQPPHSRRRNLWLIASLGGLALAMLALAISSSPALAPAPTETQSSAHIIGATPSLLAVSRPIPTATSPATAQAIEPTRLPPSTATASPAPTRIGGSQWIAFASDRSGSVQVWIMDAAAPENRQQVTEAKEGACQPTWSPDGTQIAFTTPCKGPSVYYPGSTIKIVRLADKTVTDLPAKAPGVAGAFDPAWSPDGETLLYTAILGENTQIWAIDLKDYNTRVLADRGIKNAQPAWSRDGKHIAFISSDDRNWDALWYMQPSGESQELLARSGNFSDPVWTPDGMHILASMNRGDNIPILALFDRSNPARDAVLPFQADYRMSNASISPDGQWVVFWTDLTINNPEIMLISMDGKQINQLTRNKLRDFQPAWSPD